LACLLYCLAKSGLGKNATAVAVVAVRVVSNGCPQTPPDRNDKGEWHWADAEARRSYSKSLADYHTKGIDPRNAKPGTEGWRAVNQLAEDYGYYEVRLPAVSDLTETNVDLPVGLFRNALKHKPEGDASGKLKRPLVSIYLKCETEGFLLGVIETDLSLGEKTTAK
jgi:hypothetical protein